MPTFNEVYGLLLRKGPGRSESSRGTQYRLEAKGGNILAFPKKGRVTIHPDCWGQSLTCQGTRSGGVYNGPYSIYDWYRDNLQGGGSQMKTYTAVVERCPDTGLYVGYVPGFPGAHSQAETLDELNRNLQEVIEMLLEDGEPILEGQFVGTQTVTIS